MNRATVILIKIKSSVAFWRILTCLLTPRCRVLLEKLTALQLVKKFPAFYGTRRFITALTSVRHLSLSWASPIQSTYPHPTSWRSILILSTHLRLGWRILLVRIRNYLMSVLRYKFLIFGSMVIFRSQKGSSSKQFGEKLPGHFPSYTVYRIKMSVFLIQATASVIGGCISYKGLQNSRPIHEILVLRCVIPVVC